MGRWPQVVVWTLLLLTATGCGRNGYDDHAPAPPTDGDTQTVQPSTCSAAQESANGAVALYRFAGAIVDAAKNVWTITATQQVSLNGGTISWTSGVTEIAYVNGVVWQLNTANDWWTFGVADGQATNASGPIKASPLVGVTTVSADGTTVVNATGGQITDAGQNSWAIDANQQVTFNGAAIPWTSGVNEIAYSNGVVWQLTTSNDWYSFAVASGQATKASGPTTTNPVAGTQTVSPNGSVVLAGSGGFITDAACNVWTITAQQQVALNGIAIPWTNSVTTIAYVNGVVWQLNTANDWWAFGVADGQATSTSGPTKASPLDSASATDVPLAMYLGDPALSTGQQHYSSFVAAMGEAPMAFDTYWGYGADGVGPEFDGTASYSANGLDIANTQWGAGMLPIIGIPMAMTTATATADFQAIASGDWDTAIIGGFDRYTAYGISKMWIRPGWEFSGTWYPWSVNTDNVDAFVAAFQHIADLAHAYDHAVVRVIWNAANLQSAVPYMAMYPGDAYVDVIGVDLYGVEAGGVPDDAVYSTTADPTQYTFVDAINLALANGKTLAGCEVGAGQYNTTFPANFADVLAQNPNVHLEFLALWDDPSGGSSSLYWSDTPDTAAAWKAALARVRTTRQADR